jgi:hypothetical protein
MIFASVVVILSFEICLPKILIEDIPEELVE